MKHCPVSGCQTTKPHADDPIVKGLILAFALPEKMTLWARTAMAELSESICRDLMAKKVFAWHSRLRQPEELYIRTLYALFIATEKELHHILSGDTPNGLSRLYEELTRLFFRVGDYCKLANLVSGTEPLSRWTRSTTALMLPFARL